MSSYGSCGFSGGTLINRLTTTPVTASDLIPVFSTNNADSRKISISALSDYILALIATSGQVSQYASPATGATVAVPVTAVGQNTRLILSPAGTIATLTITLDTAPVDQETISVSSTQTITALTINGGTTSGAPTTMGATTPFRLQYDGVAGVWHRI